MTNRNRLLALETELTDLGLSVRWDEPMSAHTSYQVGGPADMFVVAESEQELIAAVQRVRAHGVTPFLLGGGANLLVADAGIRGIVIQYRGTKHDFWQETNEFLLWTEAGAMLKDLSRESMSHSLEGLEWAVDVPGTIGGAIVGNAGAYGGYICDSLLSVKTLEPDGAIHELQNAECGFCYRSSKFKQQPREDRSIVLSATLVLHLGNGIEIAGRAAHYSEYRSQRHPRDPSCGSVFKRTANYPAGFLIEQCGLKGAQQGEAMISPQHANYIVNLGGARATDIKALIWLAQEQVQTQFNETLELEVELVGEW
jgi:UDP-N-acetylmuramate dehydrogenase